MGGVQADYRRLHVWPNPSGLLEAAKFIAGSLLLSHNIRRDTIAAVRIGDHWIIAYGDRVRHLRPDEENLEGWIKAILKGKSSKLGVTLSVEPPAVIGETLCVASEGLGLLELLHTLRGLPCTIIYGRGWECSIKVRKPSRIEDYMLPPLVNIILDNMESRR